MADSQSKKWNPSRALAASAASNQASRGTRTHRLAADGDVAADQGVAQGVGQGGEDRLSGLVDRGASAGASVARCRCRPSLHHQGIAPPPVGHVLPADALLEQDDALEQGLGPGRAPGM